VVTGGLVHAAAAARRCLGRFQLAGVIASDTIKQRSGIARGARTHGRFGTCSAESARRTTMRCCGSTSGRAWWRSSMARRSARSSRISFGTVFLVDGLGKGSATLEGARVLAKFLSLTRRGPARGERARLFGLQRTAHVWLQRMRGMGDGREYTNRPAPGHVRSAQITLRTTGFIASFRHPILYSC